MPVLLMSTWLRALQVATLPDTIITRTITERGWFETLVSLEQAIVGLALLVVLIMIVLVLTAIRNSVQELSRLVQTSIGDISGAAHSARNIADDVRGITKSVRSDFDTVSKAVQDVNEKVREAVDGAEVRVRRLGALVDSVQTEAEDLVETATDTLHGVRDGAKAIRHGFSFARWATSKKGGNARQGSIDEDEDEDEPEDDERPVRRRPRYRPVVRPRPRPK